MLPFRMSTCSFMMQMMRPLLDNPNEPATDGSYFDCLENVINRSRVSGGSFGLCFF